MSYEATGTITKIGPIQTFGTKNFTKREVILTIPDGKYPQTVAFEFQGERSEMPDKYNEGDEVNITFDLRGREHAASGRVYNTLNAWRITSLGGNGGRTATTAERPKHSAEGTYQRPKNTPAKAEGDLGVNPETGEEYPF